MTDISQIRTYLSSEKFAQDFQGQLKKELAEGVFFRQSLVKQLNELIGEPDQDVQNFQHRYVAGELDVEKSYVYRCTCEAIIQTTERGER